MVLALLNEAIMAFDNIFTPYKMTDSEGVSPASTEDNGIMARHRDSGQKLWRQGSQGKTAADVGRLESVTSLHTSVSDVTSF